jgi:hypothetical protein
MQQSVDQIQEKRLKDYKPRSGDSRNTRRSGFQRVSTVLDRVVTGLGLDKRIRENAVLGLWEIIAGEPWTKRSRALFLDHEGNVVISVTDASTGQELSLLKPQLLRKLKAAAAAIDVRVNGIRFDLKHFHSHKEPSITSIANPLPEPDEDQLEATKLEPEDCQQLEDLQKELAGAQSSRDFGGVNSDRIVCLLHRELQLRRWRKANGYPVCKSCNIPVRTLPQDIGMCLACEASLKNLSV